LRGELEAGFEMPQKFLAGHSGLSLDSAVRIAFPFEFSGSIVHLLPRQMLIS
jgi:hypothetical protein